MADLIFISDLHLAPERPDIIQLYLRFLQEKAGRAQQLYILGDFVEYWLGDDDPAQGLQPAFDAMKDLAEQGLQIYMMHGNRDFLMGEQLAQRCGFTLIEDPSIIEYDKEKVLLMHGDTLCTDDVDYQKLRLMLRNPAWQQDFLSKSLNERIAMAKALREQSKQETASKSADIMDVNSATVEQAFRTHDTQLIIHGHTHRPAVHSLTVDGRSVTRTVLGDWYTKGSYLEFNGVNDFELREFV